MSIEELTAAVAAEGEAAIIWTPWALPRARTTQTLIDTFPAKDLAALEAEYAKSAAPSGGKAGTNAAVVT